MVKTMHLTHCRGAGSIPGLGTKILHAAQCSQNKTKQNKMCVCSDRNVRVKLYFLACGYLAVPAPFVEETI